MKVELTEEEHKLLDDIFISNLGVLDKYYDLAKKLKLKEYLDLYKSYQ